MPAGAANDWSDTLSSQEMAPVGASMAATSTLVPECNRRSTFRSALPWIVLLVACVTVSVVVQLSRRASALAVAQTQSAQSQPAATVVAPPSTPAVAEPAPQTTTAPQDTISSANSETSELKALLTRDENLPDSTSTLTRVSPAVPMLRFYDRDFGPRTEEFDSKTNVWTVWFRGKGAYPERSEENLIFNFYARGPGTSVESIAAAILTPRDNLKIIDHFKASDDAAKVPIYFILSEPVYPEQKYGFANISKISSAGSGLYILTLTKKFTGSKTAEIDGKIQAWLAGDEAKAMGRELSHVGVDPSWEEYFSQVKK